MATIETLKELFALEDVLRDGLDAVARLELALTSALEGGHLADTTFARLREGWEEEFTETLSRLEQLLREAKTQADDELGRTIGDGP